jgi:hypothetical protein
LEPDATEATEVKVHHYLIKYTLMSRLPTQVLVTDSCLKESDPNDVHKGSSYCEAQDGTCSDARICSTKT